jgi:glycosyltransferase involved in cell wall biosynthesis
LNERVTTTLLDLGLAYTYQDAFDLIHDHTGLYGAAFANLSRVPVVMTLHGKINDSYIKLFSTFTKPSLVSISYAQRIPAPNLNYVANVYNGLSMDHYPFSMHDRGYLLYVGRICPEKGTHYAVEAALRLNMPLIIAAKLEPNLNGVYFNKFIRPKLSDQIRWIGEVNEEKRNRLYSNARAFLHPITWQEPFGLTLIEAMACGCPVIAFNRGSIPEVVSHGISGYVVGSVKEIVRVISRAPAINRLSCREYALTTFNAARMADGYERIYSRLVWQNRTAEKTRFL